VEKFFTFKKMSCPNINASTQYVWVDDNLSQEPLVFVPKHAMTQVIYNPIMAMGFSAMSTF
jgi:hypothetical protein